MSQPVYQEGSEQMWWWRVAKHLDMAAIATANAMAHNVDDPGPIPALQDKLREAQAILFAIFQAKGLIQEPSEPSMPPGMTPGVPPGMPPRPPGVPPGMTSMSPNALPNMAPGMPPGPPPGPPPGSPIQVELPLAEEPVAAAAVPVVFHADVPTPEAVAESLTNGAGSPEAG